MKQIGKRNRFDGARVFDQHVYGKRNILKHRSRILTNMEVYNKKHTGGTNRLRSMKKYEWKTSPTIESVLERLEMEFDVQFDNCLVHQYPNGKVNIGCHNDKKAPNTSVVSCSFGTPRKFRFRSIGQTDGWIEELVLSSGYLL